MIVHRYGLSIEHQVSEFHAYSIRQHGIFPYLTSKRHVGRRIVACILSTMNYWRSHMNMNRRPQKGRTNEMSEDGRALEISGDKRLGEIGIDLGTCEMDVLRRLDEIQKEEAERQVTANKEPYA